MNDARMEPPPPPNDPSKVLEQARKHLEALKQTGLSHEALVALLQEEIRRPAHPGHIHHQLQQQPSQQHLAHQYIQSPSQQSPHQTSPSQSPSPSHQQRQFQQQQGGAAPVEGFDVFRGVPGYIPEGIAELPGSGSLAPPPANYGGAFAPTHQVRSSVSSTASNSSSGARSVTPSAGASDAKYWCTSCDKTFKRKFDWKRHEEEFHERWRKYPCPNCNQSFWGPNTFNQHHKSAHGCKSCPHSDNVVKYMRKRKAWGCGFCAAMHGKLEKHYEHVASHFEAGALKGDWLHSNVIYGLLHQPLVLEAWRELLLKKQHKFNGHQPMFSWSPDNTARAQGYVENESPGQLQDFLEFFDNTRETAEKIARCAWGYVHVVLRPKAGQGEASAASQDSISLGPPSPVPQPASGYETVSITSQSQGLRRTASTTLMPVARQPSRQLSTSQLSSTSSFPEQTLTPTSLTSPVDAQSTSSYQGFLTPPMVPSHSSVSLVSDPMQVQQQEQSQRPLSLNKELPQPPLLPSPMDVDFNSMFGTAAPGQMQGDAQMMPDWQQHHGLPNDTMLEDQVMSNHAMAAQTHSFSVHVPVTMNWENLAQYNGSSTTM